MQYLVERYDTEYKISFPKGTREYYEMNNWLFFMNAGVGPMQGQASKSEISICHEGNEAMERIDSPVRQHRVDITYSSSDPPTLQKSTHNILE